ncbi:MAG: hypothetical protein CM15mP22_5620 [Gammaproteobacteria bacterium]|nr:MAG: hypothetical protein CM15mP22_5620 [Gammaproteobacteria bacterium]
MALSKELTNHSLPEIGEALVAEITQLLFMHVKKRKN